MPGKKKKKKEIARIRIVSRFADHHPDLFSYLKADKVYPHDKFLQWTILRLLPKKMTPNQLTTIRLIGTPVVIWLIALGEIRLGTALFVFVALTDALDGALARTQNKITRWGMMYDPFADKILIGSLILLVALRHFPPWLALTTLAIEVVFIFTALIAKFKFNTVHAANRWGKIKMMLQVVAVFLTLIALLIGSPNLISVATGLFGAAIGFALISLFTHGI